MVAIIIIIAVVIVIIIVDAFTMLPMRRHHNVTEARHQRDSSRSLYRIQNQGKSGARANPSDTQDTID